MAAKKEKKIKCEGCGHKGMTRTNMNGRTFPYKQYDVELGTDVTLYTCSKCDNIAMTPGELKALDEALERALTRAL